MKKAVCGILIAAMLAAVFGCGKQDRAPTVPATEPTESAEPAIAGNDVFAGARFDEMLWGYYEASTYAYTGDSAKDTAEFLQEMDYVTVSAKYGELQLSALPLDIQMGSYSQFMAAFFYEGEYYSAGTETGRAMFCKAYMEKFGDLTAEDFQKLQQLLQMNVAQMTFVQPDGQTQRSTCAYEIQGGTLILYKLSIDEQYNATLGEEYARYDFLHDGGKLILDCSGIQREYLANGYKDASQDRLCVAGFAQDRSKQYENLEGLTLYATQAGEGFEIDITLNNGARPVDPTVSFDKTTGDFSVTWTVSDYYSGQLRHDTPRKISGKLIPCTGYGFNDFSGFFLLIDGVCYPYLLSEEDYIERRRSNIVNADGITDLQWKMLSQLQVSMLAEIEQECRFAEIPASIDYVRGQVTLEADRLFGTDSPDITGEGQDLLQRFWDIYSEVILKEEYYRYVFRVEIEGHTNADGSYSEKQTLSADRAEAVAKSCVIQNASREMEIRFAGCAYDYPVLDDDGSVNAGESDRMVFRFFLAAN